jgi:hypothetical protein
MYYFSLKARQWVQKICGRKSVSIFKTNILPRRQLQYNLIGANVEVKQNFCVYDNNQNSESRA